MADRAASYEVFEELENEPAQDAALPTGACLLCSGALEECEEGLFDTRFGFAGRYEVRRCADCGLEQLFPAPEPAALKALYESHYNFGGETGALYTRLRERFLFSFLNPLWSWLDGDISFYLRRGAGRLLDIGCNEGR